MGTEFVGLGSINDPRIASRVSWTANEIDLFYKLLATRKSDPKYIAQAMNKSYLEIQARCDYLDTLAKHVGPIDRKIIPYSHEIPDFCPDLGLVELMEPEPSRRALTAREDALLFSGPSLNALNESKWRKFCKERCDEHATICRREMQDEFLDRARLFLIDTITDICNQGTTDKVGRHRVLSYLDANFPHLLVGSGACAEPCKSSQDRTEPNTEVAPESDVSMSINPLNYQESVEKVASDLESYPNMVMELEEENALDELDEHNTKRFLETLAGTNPSPAKVYVSMAELDYLKRQFRECSFLRDQDKVCFACGLRGGRRYSNGERGLDVLCYNCENWVDRRQRQEAKTLSAQEVLDARFPLHVHLKSCDLCGNFDDYEYRKGTTPFENVCRKCSLWIIHNGPVSVEEVGKYFHKGPHDFPNKASVFRLR